MMEAIQNSEILVNLYQCARRYNQDGSHLHSHSLENLKSYLFLGLFLFSVSGKFEMDQRRIS
jgi:hypothetical protein